MATRASKPSRKHYEVVRSSSIPSVQEIDLPDHTAECLRIYGSEVNLDRAVVDIRDGLKPVSRRLLWALHTIRGDGMVKTARLSGETIGKYHPHGDTSVNGAVLTQVITSTPPLTGVGNWGSLIDPPGASRYTNVLLSKFGDTFFHKDYLPLVPMVDNYDGKNKEPLVFPSLLPNILLNGSTGIGLGMATSYPSFTPRSILPILADLAEGQELSNEDIASRLEFHHPYGGQVIKSKQNRESLLTLLESPKATIQWMSPIQPNRESKEIHISKFGPEINPVRLIERWVKQQPEVMSVSSGKGVSYDIRCRRNLNTNEFDEFVAKLQKQMNSSQSYDLYVTNRVVDKKNPSNYEVKFARVSLRKVIDTWLRYRISLETKSIQYRIDQSESRVAHFDLLILACDNLDIIFKALRLPDPKSYIIKHLKITPEQADTILNLKVRQLSKLDNDEIQNQKKKELANLASLRKSLKIPHVLVANYLREKSEEFKLVQNDWSLQWVL